MPQLRLFVFKSTQVVPPHRNCPVGHTILQTPCTQPSPAGQAWPQPPQFAPSVCGLTQEPRQMMLPGVVHVHIAALHVAFVGHTLPHEPQF